METLFWRPRGPSWWTALAIVLAVSLFAYVLATRGLPTRTLP